MADYNLGRARGTIDIDYDGSGARRAQADMAATSAEAAALDSAMGRVNEQFDRHRETQIQTAEEIVAARGEVDRLRRAYQQYQEEYERAQRRVAEARDNARDVLAGEADDIEKVARAHETLNRAQDDADRARGRAAQAYDEYRDRMAAVRIEIDRFNAAHVEATRGFRNFGREAERLGGILEGLEEKLSGVARILGQVGIFGLFGGAAGGQLFASAAGGMHLLVTAMAAVVEVANAFVGAIALIPSVVNAGVLSIGTLAVAFQGVGAAIGAMNDPAEFVKAIRDLSPAAQQAMLTLQSFTEAFRGVRYAVQESLFAPIVADIQPLVMQWLPMLQNSMKSIASEFGQSFHQIFQYFQTPEAQSSFQTFTQNLVAGFQAARGAIQPFLEAWNTLAEAGSGVFVRLGSAITDVANKFNAWIQRTSATGQLAEYLNKALDAFTNMGRIIRDVAFGINNMLGVFNGVQGQTALQTIADLSAKFRDWTESVSGQNAIFSFFSLIRTAADAVRPALSLFGDSLAIIGRTLTELGIAIQPGVTSFFQSFKDALAGLAPYVKDAAPAINQFLSAFGTTLQQVIASIGPQLPELLQDLSDAFVSLMKVIPPVVDVFARFLGNLTPTQVEVFLGLLGAIKLLNVTWPLLTGAVAAFNVVMAANPIGLVVIAAGALAAAAYLIINNWDQVSETFKNVWTNISSAVSGWWNDAFEWGRRVVDNFVQGMRSWFGEVGNAAGEIGDKIYNFLFTNSPAREGPLNRTSPDAMGQSVARNFAGGLASGSPAVSDAAGRIAGEAGAIGGSAPSAGFGSQSFSSSGIAGRSGRDFMSGNSGFDQWVRFITQDLTAWNNIFRQAFSLVNSISSIVTDTVRAVANLWDGGDNSLTRPGGLLGPPLPISQQQVPGVESKPIPGVAPDKWGQDLAALTGQGPNAQQSVPGVEGRREGGRPSTAPPAQPNQVQGQAPANGGGTPGAKMAPITVNPDGTISSPDPTWQHLITRESGGRNIGQQITDANGGPGSPNAAQGYFQITPDTWRANGGEEFAPNPMAATPEQQAQVAARILGSDPGAWGFYRHEGREDPAALSAALVPVPGAAAPPGAGGPVPGAVPLDQLPPIIPARDSGLASNDRGGTVPNLFLAHTQEGREGTTPEELISSMAGGQFSYNNYIDSNTGRVVVGVPRDRASVGTGGVNERAINTVFTGSTVDWTREEWLQRMPALQQFARLAAESGVPLVNIEGNTDPNAAGIGGHDWATAAGFPTDGHSDPGPNFPWDVVMGLAQQYRAGQDPGAAAGPPDPNRPRGSADLPGGAPGGEQLTPEESALLPLLGATGLSGYAALVTTRAYFRAVSKSRAAERAGAAVDLTPEERAAVQRVSPVQNQLPREMRIPQTNLGGRQLPGGDYRGAPEGGGWRTATPDSPYGPTPKGNTSAGSRQPVPDIPPGKPRPPAGATVPRVAPSAAAQSGPGLRARIEAIGRAGGRIAGPMLSFLNGAAVSYAIVDEAVSQVERDLIAEGYSFTTDGTVLGIPVIDSKIKIDSGAVEKPYNPNEQRPPAANAGAQFGQRPPGTGGIVTREGDDMVVRPSDGSPEYRVPWPEGRTTFGYEANLPPRPGANVGLANTEQSTAPDPRRQAIDASRGSNTPTGQQQGWRANPLSLAKIPLRGTTTESVRAAGLAPLYRNGVVPEEIQALAAEFGLEANTRTTGGSLHEAGFAFDITGAPEDMDRFSQFVADNLGSQTLELIHMNERTGQKWEWAGGRRVGAGTDLPNYYDETIADHGDYGSNAHVHWATDVLPVRGGAAPVPPSRMPPGRDGQRGGQSNADDDWMNVPNGWDLNTPIPFEVLQANLGRGGKLGAKGMTDDEIRALPPMYYNAQPGTVQNVPVGDDYNGPYQVSPGRTISVPTTTGSPTPGFPETNDQRSPIDKFSSAMSAASSIAGDAFTVFQDVIASIGATANITKTLVRGFENTEDIVNVIQQFQTFIKTGADIAKLVGDSASAIGSVIPSAGGADFGGTEGAKAALGAVSAVASIVQSAFEVTNAAISLGIDIYHQVGKYAGFYFGGNLGGDNTGPLGGNVRMLLNTRTNELMTYSEDNPLNKNTFAISPMFQSYDHTPNAQQPLPPTVNIYTGPGQTPRDMMNESMWLVSTGAPAVASVAGAE